MWFLRLSVSFWCWTPKNYFPVIRWAPVCNNWLGWADSLRILWVRIALKNLPDPLPTPTDLLALHAVYGTSPYVPPHSSRPKRAARKSKTKGKNERNGGRSAEFFPFLLSSPLRPGFGRSRGSGRNFKKGKNLKWESAKVMKTNRPTHLCIFRGIRGI